MCLLQLFYYLVFFRLYWDFAWLFGPLFLLLVGSPQSGELLDPLGHIPIFNGVGFWIIGYDFRPIKVVHVDVGSIDFLKNGPLFSWRVLAKLHFPLLITQTLPAQSGSDGDWFVDTLIHLPSP